MKANNGSVRLSTVFAFVLFVAFHTIVVLLFNMSPKIGRLGEPVSTNSTLKRFLSSVNNNVMQKRLTCREFFVTDAADE